MSFSQKVPPPPPPFLDNNHLKRNSRYQSKHKWFGVNNRLPSIKNRSGFLKRRYQEVRENTQQTERQNKHNRETILHQ